MTGAPVPEGADAVQQVEVTRELESGSIVEILEPVASGRSIVRRATEIRSGETVMTPGEKINAPAMAVLASFGYSQVKVGSKPKLAVLSTGTELVSVEQEPGPDQIRDSNNYSIAAYAIEAGAQIKRLPLANDDIELLKRQILETADWADVIVTSGGVSMGLYDFTKTAVKELGAEVFFDRVALRPGKPTVFARLPNGKLFFGLPGNPVSVSVTFNLFVRTALLGLQGAAETILAENWAVLSQELKGVPDRESYLPSRLSSTTAGQLLAEPLKWGGSSDFVGFARANALIKVPAGRHVVQAHAPIRILHLPT
jgi:molybdenum cofactor synthesis domain-containing protein